MITLNEGLGIFRIALRSKHQMMFVSRPGVGKTVGMTDVAHEEGFDVVLIHPVGYDPTDMRGFPALYKDEGVAKFLPFGDLAMLLNATKPTLAIFDDLGQQVSTLVQASLMHPLEAKIINGKRIPDHVLFAAATNTSKGGTGVAGIITPLLNRFHMIVEVEPEVKGFQNYILKKNYKNAPMLAAFIEHKPEHLLKWDPPQGIEGSCTPRSMEKLLSLLDAPYPERARLEIASSCTGRKFAVEFIGFMKLANEFPDLSLIETNPKGVAIPDVKQRTGLQVLLALCGALAQRINQKNANNILSYIDRFPVEYKLLAMRFAFQANNKVVANSEVFQEHALKHADLYAGI